MCRGNEYNNFNVFNGRYLVKGIFMKYEEDSSLREKLENRYANILDNHVSLVEKICSSGNWSNIHLGFVPDGYSNVPENRRILVIGRETRGWFSEKNYQKYGLAEVKYMVDKSKEYFDKTANPKKTGKGKTFFHFIRKLTRNFNEKGILWGNLYAFDFKKGDPKKNNEGISILELEMLSAELLKAQIEILKPRIIIFATGNGGVDSRKRMFNLDFSGKDEFYDKSGNLLPKKYVEFFKFSEQAEHNEIYSTIDGYRIRHPSSRYKKDSYARDSLVKHLLNKNC